MYKSKDEKELVRLCGLKDARAAEELYRRYAARVYSLCRRYLRDNDAARDVMHDAFIHALEKIDSFHYSEEGSLYKWISTIAINMSLSYIVRHQRKMISLDSWQDDICEELSEDNIIEVPREKLMEWVAALPDWKRVIFNLYYIENYTHKEIAEMLNISEKGSASALAKARKQLKDIIKKDLEEMQQ